MVDLHESLRPAVTAAPPPVEEIAARARGRRRRRRASATGVGVLAIGLAAVATAGALRGPDATVTVADASPDGPSEATSPTTEDSPTWSEPRPEPDALAPSPTSGLAADSGQARDRDGSDLGDGSDRIDGSGDGDGSASSTDQLETPSSSMAPPPPRPTTSPGLAIDETITSRWEDGYCLQIEVVNDAAERSAWQVVLDLDGTIATTWNAAVADAGDGRFVFSGLADYNPTIGPGEATTFGACVDTVSG